MQNTFSRSFKLNETTEKKFYFKPEKTAGVLHYQVHINNDLELKKFTVIQQDGAWKIKPQTIRLPEWLYTLEQQFDEKIIEAIASQKK
jgi:hypothetical protein